jgi:GT2 family glycosyltransferase
VSESRYVSVVVLAYGEEPLLQACVTAVLDSVTREGDPVDLEVIVVDNGARAAVSALAPHPRLRVVTMESNTGFTGGCNAGAQEARGRVLVFVNSDAVVSPTAVWSLAHELKDDTIGLACGSLRLLDAPDTMNSAGNPVHYLGVVWAGGYGEPSTRHAESRDVTAITGAFFGARRDTWDAFGGFDPLYFAYHEDAELSLRCRQRGLRVRYCAEAIALHDYDFSRHAQKRYLVERNRWLALVTLYPRPVLVAVIPALLAFEVAMLAMATIQGWLPAKLRGYWWLLQHAAEIRQHRGLAQAANTLSPRDFAQLLSARIEPAMLEPVAGLELLNALLIGYWWCVNTLLRLSSPRPPR